MVIFALKKREKIIIMPKIEKIKKIIFEKNLYQMTGISIVNNNIKDGEKVKNKYETKKKE